jgi:hypothetical protein
MVQPLQINKCDTAHKGKKNHMITGYEKTFNKIQHSFMIKTLKKVRIEETYLNIIKAIYDKYITHIILNEEKLKPFFSKVRNETRVSTLFTLIQHSARILNQSNKAR